MFPPLIDHLCFMQLQFLSVSWNWTVMTMVECCSCTKYCNNNVSMSAMKFSRGDGVKQKKVWSLVFTIETCWKFGVLCLQQKHAVVFGAGKGFYALHVVAACSSHEKWCVQRC